MSARLVEGALLLDCRYIWWAVIIELPIVIGLASSLFGWGGVFPHAGPVCLLQSLANETMPRYQFHAASSDVPACNASLCHSLHGLSAVEQAARAVLKGLTCCCAGSTYNTLARFRLAWIGLLAIATVLQMWAANVTLNLTDTAPSLVMVSQLPTPGCFEHSSQLACRCYLSVVHVVGKLAQWGDRPCIHCAYMTYADSLTVGLDNRSQSSNSLVSTSVLLKVC